MPFYLLESHNKSVDKVQLETLTMTQISIGVLEQMIQDVCTPIHLNEGHGRLRTCLDAVKSEVKRYQYIEKILISNKKVEPIDRIHIGNVAEREHQKRKDTLRQGMYCGSYNVIPNSRTSVAGNVSLYYTTDPVLFGTIVEWMVESAAQRDKWEGKLEPYRLKLLADPRLPYLRNSSVSLPSSRYLPSGEHQVFEKVEFPRFHYSIDKFRSFRRGADDFQYQNTLSEYHNEIRIGHRWNNAHHGVQEKYWCFGYEAFMVSEDFSDEREAEGLRISDNYFNDHYDICAGCGDTCSNDDVSYSEALDDNFCSDCFNDRHTGCNHCGATVCLDSENHHVDLDDEAYCTSCTDAGYGRFQEDDEDEDFEEDPPQPQRVDMRRRPERIRDYYARVDTNIVMPVTGRIRDQGSLDSEVSFGMELELNFPRQVAEQIIDVSEKPDHFPRQLAIWKHDGSLSTGAEFVTRPHTLTSFKERNFKKFLEDVRALGADGYQSGECGLHIHLGRNQATQSIKKSIINSFKGGKNEPDGMAVSTDWARAVSDILFTFNFQTYGDFFIQFSKRLDRDDLEDGQDALNYCSTKTARNSFDFDWWRHERRRGFNVQNLATYEVRIWRSTTDFKRVMAYVGVSVAFYEYVLMKTRCGLITSNLTNSFSFFDFLKDEPRFRPAWDAVRGEFKIEQMRDWDKMARTFARGNKLSRLGLSDLSLLAKPRARQAQIERSSAEARSRAERRAAQARQLERALEGQET